MRAAKRLLYDQPQTNRAYSIHYTAQPGAGVIYYSIILINKNKGFHNARALVHSEIIRARR
jgi:hypothetical protein